MVLTGPLVPEALATAAGARRTGGCVEPLLVHVGGTGVVSRVRRGPGVVGAGVVVVRTLSFGTRTRGVGSVFSWYLSLDEAAYGFDEV